MTTAPHVPVPPPGPGVQPPFPAPPVEGKGKRIGWGLGIGAGVMVLICGGGFAALIGLGSSVTGALDEQAHAAVNNYLTALRDARYDQAYGQLCSDARRNESVADFRTRVQGEERITNWRLGSLNTVYLTVPVTATIEGGQTEELEASLDQNTQTGEFEVCKLGE
jgi:type II secretory pathway pseudopilin PulG